MPLHFGTRSSISQIIDDVKLGFDNLHTLQKGDELRITNEAGVTMTFVVRELRTYGEHEDALAVFVSHDGLPHLNLVTCQGVWNKTLKSYSNRLVVFADALLFSRF